MYILLLFNIYLHKKKYMDETMRILAKDLVKM